MSEHGMRTKARGWFRRDVEGQLENAAGGRARLRVVVLLAFVLALDSADKATIGATAVQLEPPGSRSARSWPRPARRWPR